MSKLLSQRDSRWKDVIIPNSNLTLGNYGCYILSITILAGMDSPVPLLKRSNFARGGLLYSDRVAKDAGMTYVRATTTTNDNWCIGVTDHYKAQGFPTHFLVVNTKIGLMVDPLKLNPTVEPLTYKIFQYRIFDGVKFGTIDNQDRKDLQNVINLVSESWNLQKLSQDKLHEANNLLRSLI